MYICIFEQHTHQGADPREVKELIVCCGFYRAVAHTKTGVHLAWTVAPRARNSSGALEKLRYLPAAAGVGLAVRSDEGTNSFWQM